MNKDSPFEDFVNRMHINDYRVILFRRLVKRVFLGYFIGFAIQIAIKRLIAEYKFLNTGGKHVAHTTNDTKLA